MQASEERQKKKQKRKAEEGQLQAKRQEMDKAKVSILCPRTLPHRKRQAYWLFHRATYDKRGELLLPRRCLPRLSDKLLDLKNSRILGSWNVAISITWTRPSLWKACVRWSTIQRSTMSLRILATSYELTSDGRPDSLRLPNPCHFA